MTDVLSSDQAPFEADILHALFAGFEVRNIRHAVLRNYERLPDSVGARDIDIVVHPDDLKAVRDIVVRIVEARGLRYGNYYADERLTQFALVGRDADGGLQQIKLDFFIRSEVYGVQFLSAEEMLADLRHHNGVAVVSDPVMLLDKWLFHLLVGRPLHTKYDASFAEIARVYPDRLIQSLSRLLPDDRAKELVQALAEGKGSQLVLTKSERRRALAKLWRAQKGSAVGRSLSFARFRLRERLRPHGVFLSISGPDGAGKTTVIGMVIEQLGAIWGDDAVHYEHFRPKLLPRIAEVAKKARAVETVDEDYDRPHRAKPSGFVGSVARLGYYGLDYLGGYVRTVRPVLRRRQVMLFDRYYYDMIADSFRSRISLPLPVLRSLGGLLPLPRHAFFIDVDPEEIHRRKQELTMERIVTLNARYGDLADHGWLIRVDNNGSPRIAAARIVDRIVDDRDARARKALQ